jgi:hypothetical protein
MSTNLVSSLEYQGYAQLDEEPDRRGGGRIWTRPDPVLSPRGRPRQVARVRPAGPALCAWRSMPPRPHVFTPAARIRRAILVATLEDHHEARP